MPGGLLGSAPKEASSADLARPLARLQHAHQPGFPLRRRRFVFLYPELNERCSSALAAYRACLTNERSFAEWTLEKLTTAIREAGVGDWVHETRERYLGFE